MEIGPDAHDRTADHVDAVHASRRHRFVRRLPFVPLAFAGDADRFEKFLPFLFVVFDAVPVIAFSSFVVVVTVRTGLESGFLRLRQIFFVVPDAAVEIRQVFLFLRPLHRLVVLIQVAFGHAPVVPRALPVSRPEYAVGAFHRSAAGGDRLIRALRPDQLIRLVFAAVLAPAHHVAALLRVEILHEFDGYGFVFPLHVDDVAVGFGLCVRIGGDHSRFEEADLVPAHQIDSGI